MYQCYDFLRGWHYVFCVDCIWDCSLFAICISVINNNNYTLSSSIIKFYVKSMYILTYCFTLDVICMILKGQL